MFNKYSNMEGADQEYENELERLTYKMMALTTENELEKKAASIILFQRLEKSKTEKN